MVGLVLGPFHGRFGKTKPKRQGKDGMLGTYSTLAPRCRSASICSRVPPPGTRGGSKVKLCYISTMSLGLKELLEKSASWPQEDQEELAEAAAEIEARRTGRYAMTEAELAAVNNGLQQIQSGEFVSDVEMQSFWKRFGVA
jgi:hypothetical protein